MMMYEKIMNKKEAARGRNVKNFGDRIIVCIY